MVSDEDEMQLQMISEGKCILLKSKDRIKSVSVYSLSGDELIRQSGINRESQFTKRNIYSICRNTFDEKTMKIMVK